MPYPQSFHRRARAIPARFEPNISQSSDLFTPPSHRDRRHTFHAPNHEPHHRVPRAARRRNHDRRSRSSSSSDAAGIQQYQDTIHPAVIGLYKSIKASAARLQSELDSLSANIDKIAPGEDHMEWKHSPGTIIYVPMAHGFPDTTGDAGIIRPNDIAPKLTVPHPHHPPDHSHMLNNHGTGGTTNPDAPHQPKTNIMPQVPPNQPAIPNNNLFANTTNPFHTQQFQPIHQNHEQPTTFNATQPTIPHIPGFPGPNTATVPFNTNPTDIKTNNNAPSTLPPILQNAIDILQNIYDNRSAAAAVQQLPTPVPSPSALTGGIFNAPLSDTNAPAKSRGDVVQHTGMVQDQDRDQNQNQGWRDGTDASY